VRKTYSSVQVLLQQKDKFEVHYGSQADQKKCYSVLLLSSSELVSNINLLDIGRFKAVKIDCRSNECERELNAQRWRRNICCIIAVWEESKDKLVRIIKTAHDLG
jgi:hypothetical protein